MLQITHLDIPSLVLSVQSASLSLISLPYHWYGQSSLWRRLHAEAIDLLLPLWQPEYSTTNLYRKLESILQSVLRASVGKACFLVIMVQYFTDGLQNQSCLRPKLPINPVQRLSKLWFDISSDSSDEGYYTSFHWLLFLLKNYHRYLLLLLLQIE